MPSERTQHGIADDVGAERDRAADDVLERDVAAGGHLEANRRPVRRPATRPADETRSRPRQRPMYFGGWPAASAARRSPSSCCGGAEAIVRLPRVEQPRRVRPVEIGALRLAVGPVGPADVGTLVPGQAHPAEVVEDAGLRRAGGALDVGVFDAQHERARPPRASSQLNSAVRALPTCRWPVGDGAKRTRIVAVRSS